MLNFYYASQNGVSKLLAVSTEYRGEAINRNDIQNLAHAEEIAADATALTGTLHIAVDQGSHTSPRYDVIEAPKVGDEVSRAFNGDYYPAGKIVQISKSLKRIVTDTGVVFYRVRQTASWRSSGTWYMYPGHRSELNPSF